MYGFTAICWALGAWDTCRAYVGGGSEARVARPGLRARLLYAPEARPRRPDYDAPPRPSGA